MSLLLIDRRPSAPRDVHAHRHVHLGPDDADQQPRTPNTTVRNSMSTDSAALTPGTRPQVPAGIDPRGPQVAAAITSVVLAVTLLLGDSTAALVLLGLQAAVFAVGAAAGPQHAPYGWVFRTLVRPRLQPPTELEDPAPPRFAQAVGLGFVVVALAAYLLGATLVGQVAVGFALVAALLNAVFAFCLGCEVYLLAKRATA